MSDGVGCVAYVQSYDTISNDVTKHIIGTENMFQRMTQTDDAFCVEADPKRK